MVYVFPMMGLSSRFTNAGFKVPKYMLPFSGGTIFEAVLKSFKKEFSDNIFIFILKSNNIYISDIEKIIISLQVKKYKIILLNNDTMGQAHTVFEGLQTIKQLNDQITIFNIDTIHLSYEYPSTFMLKSYLELFVGEGNHWSFADIKDNRVVKLTEKERISEYCSNGLYVFESAKLFLNIYDKFYFKTSGEQYIAPMYNCLIKNNIDVGFKIVKKEQLIFVGTPEEYYYAQTQQ
jgi:NDP-sugar pyrophosphorylase family protein